MKELENPISGILAEEIKDSRGNPTLKISITAGGQTASFSVPSGASTGSREAKELRDEDGKGVQRAILKVKQSIAPKLLGVCVTDQKKIDQLLITLDGTEDKSNLGGNGMIGISIACAKVAALTLGLETYEYLETLIEVRPSRKIPRLYMNLINGGKHASNGLAFQEYLVVPNTQNISEAIGIGIKIDNTLKEIILRELGEESIVFGDEGGFAPKLTDIKQPLYFLREAIKKHDLEGKVGLALDVAASSFYENGEYVVSGAKLNKEELLGLHEELNTEFKFLSIEDPFFEKDFESFEKLRDKGGGMLVVGDDLTVTNPRLLQEAIDKKSINAIIIKPNQIGTLTETLETMVLAQKHNIELIVSHRSGETEDDFIADLAYATGSFGLKAGAPTKPERLIKYKRLETIINNKK